MHKRKRTPTYRLHKQSGQAVVTLRDTVTGKARDVLLGPYDTDESRQRYDAVIAEWLAAGRRLQGQPQQAPPSGGMIVAEVIAPYWQWAQGYYTKGERATIRSVIRVLRTIANRDPVQRFGPARLREVRGEMIRLGWSRPTINRCVNKVRAIFKWAAAREMIDYGVYERLTTLEPLKKGKTEAPEPDPIQPVNDQHVQAVKPHVSRQVAAMIDLQLLTGARAGELVNLRPIDLDTSDDTWRVELDEHKTAHRGRKRTLYLGPKAQAVVRPFLDRPVDKPLFSPREAVAEAAAQADSHRRPDQQDTPRQTNRRVREVYDVPAYRRAIERGCDKAFPPPEPLTVRDGETIKDRDARLTDEQREQLKQWRREHRFSPHQLRHTAATNIRRDFGLDAAQVVLGHAGADITQVYAALDEAKAVEVVKRIG